MLVHAIAQALATYDNMFVGARAARACRVDGACHRRRKFYLISRHGHDLAKTVGSYIASQQLSTIANLKKRTRAHAYICARVYTYIRIRIRTCICAHALHARACARLPHVFLQIYSYS